MNKIEVRLTLTSPMNFASAEAVYGDDDSGRITFTKTGTPATGTMKMPVALPIEAAEMENKQVSPTPRVPIIPANTLRGGLRRAAADIIFESFAERNPPEKLSIEAVHVLTCGAATGQPEGSMSLTDRDDQLENAYFCTFGGGPKLMRSFFQSSTGWPIINPLIDAGILPDSEKEVATAQTIPALTRGLNFRRVDDILEFSPIIEKAEIVDYPESVTAWIESVTENTAARSAQRKEGPGDGEKTKKSALKSWNMMEVIIPGTKFYFDLTILPNMNSAAIGCLILSLERLLSAPLGGRSSLGFGRFIPEVLFDGAPLFKPGTSTIDEDHPTALTHIGAFSEWLAGTTAEDIEKFIKE